jgi:hypothetical protein
MGLSALSQTRATGPAGTAAGLTRWLLLAAPTAAVLTGLAAEYLDFRALRVPILLGVGFAVLPTAYALSGGRPGLRTFSIGVATGTATWAAAETVYVVIHAATGGTFSADRFGPQWAQALGLIAAHGVFLGVPTGIVAGLLLQLTRFRRRDAAIGE